MERGASQELPLIHVTETRFNPQFKASEKLRGVCFWLSYKSAELSRPLGLSCADLAGDLFSQPITVV
jgi:hypothetical protein